MANIHELGVRYLCIVVYQSCHVQMMLDSSKFYEPCLELSREKGIDNMVK